MNAFFAKLIFSQKYAKRKNCKNRLFEAIEVRIYRTYMYVKLLLKFRKYCTSGMVAKNRQTLLFVFGH